MRNLKGRKFKRNKYGLSKWTDTITAVFITKKLISINPIIFKDEYNVIGEKNKFVYSLNEIKVLKK